MLRWFGNRKPKPDETLYDTAQKIVAYVALGARVPIMVGDIAPIVRELEKVYERGFARAKTAAPASPPPHRQGEEQ